MSMAIATLILAATLALAAESSGEADPTRSDEPHPDPLSASDVVWTSPSRDENGSMPIGNGDLGANVWWNEQGELWMFLSKTDAWDDNARLLKLGRIAIRLHPAPLPVNGFRQRLDLREGEIECEVGGAARFRVRADANRPVIVVEIDSDSPVTASISLDHWRNAPREVKDLSWSDVYCADHGAPGVQRTITGPDTVLPITSGPLGAELLWFHWNERTPIPATFELQGLASLLPAYRDPILHRAFGCLVTGTGLAASGERSLESSVPASSHRIEIWAATHRDTTPDGFATTLRSLARQGSADDPRRVQAAHRAHWDSFWQRSWMRVSESQASRSHRLPDNRHLVRIGQDSAGGNRFRGAIENALIYTRPLGADEIASMRRGRAPEDVALSWASGGPEAIPDSVGLDGAAGLTVAAWITPALESDGGGRIVDKATPGAADGWLLDTYPGNSLRFLAGDTACTFNARLEPGKPVFVVGTHDARDGRRRLFVDGEPVAETPSQPSAAETVNRAYALQRYITACAGRGGAPIKFNGSIFTVPRNGHDDGDPDWRKWGPGYWFQNTRLIYWPLFASGDADLTDPFFAMYREALPLVVARAAASESDRVAPGGATFHETISFWGLPDNSSFGWKRNDAPIGAVLNPYIRHYRSGSLELLAMALERFAYAPDPGFASDTLLPLADAFLIFYASYYPRNADGTIRFEPAASLETWHDATDPLPEIAGLRYVMTRLLSLAPTVVDEGRRAAWSELLNALPPIPVGDGPGGAVLKPAVRYSSLANIENPELYAIFPYRHFGVGKPDVDIARRTFAARVNRNNVGWCQDSIHAAHVGLADEAAAMVVRRASTKDAKSRFPAFWGPNYDWVPDQDHGSNILTTLQSMMIQCEGKSIVLMPAWPRGWDCEFRLHAPGNTVLTGWVRDGYVASLIVSPPERLDDVTILRTSGE
jgi:Domain of unknown function (DUF5703)/Concanavalin A-like lectin/glucanases superfamily